MNAHPTTKAHPLRRWFVTAGFVAFGLVLLVGSLRNPSFWRTPDQNGDALLADGKFTEAAQAYTDPLRVGVAQYRNGDFEDAAGTFARVPGATGAFNQGNAWFMHGQYETAIESYDRALDFRPEWQDAEDNKALALARNQLLDDAGANRAEESAEAYQPDEIVTDENGENQTGKPVEMNSSEMSDAELRATWLRRVQTTPGDFLRAKFAYQASHAGQGNERMEDGKDGGQTP